MKQKIALITGSTAGIGYAIAEKLAKGGFSVVINGRSQERVDLAIDSLIKKDISRKSLIGIAADLTTLDGIKKVLQMCPVVQVLVNNFGIFEPKEFVDITDEDWEQVWNANVMSGVRLSRHYFPKMIAENAGRVIFISSESGVQVPAEIIHYGVSKTAQIAFARGLAEIAAGSGVTVNSVIVGPTKSEGMGIFLKQLGEKYQSSEEEIEKNFFKTARATSILKRFIDPNEIAAFVAFLASEASSAITGAALRADGGVVKSIL